MKNIDILVVDDNPFMGKLIQKMLKQLGISRMKYECNVVDALETLQKQNFDLIITDWVMPNLNGREFIQVLRESNKTKETPMFVITAAPGEHQARFCQSHGVSSILKKPFSVTDLKHRIDFALKNKVQSKKQTEKLTAIFKEPEPEDDKFLLNI